MPVPSPRDLARRSPSRQDKRRAQAAAPPEPVGVLVRCRIDYQRFIRGGSLHPDARLVALVLSTFADDNGRIPSGYQPSLAQMCGATGLQEGRLRACLDALERGGWITRPHRPVGHTMPAPITLTRPQMPPRGP